MDGASKIFYTFNWLYVDSKDTGYFVSGLDPIRPSNVDPDLPTWGTGQRRVAAASCRGTTTCTR